jgi:hypothetical protein
MQAGRLEVFGERIEEMAVGGKGQLEGFVPERTKCREFADEVEESAAQQRFAAGKTDLGDAEGDKETDEPEVLGSGQFGVLRALFSGAAVDALVVTAICNGNTKIVYDSAVAVREPEVGGNTRGIDQRNVSHWYLQGYTVWLKVA